MDIASRKDSPMLGMSPCSRCGKLTAGVELSPGAISSVCRPGEGCSVVAKFVNPKKAMTARKTKNK